MRLAVIPARGGSKRIPRKNIKFFCGKPIIAWSIEAAQQSCCFDRIVVSTDDTEIGDVARELGAEVPFRRPAYLSDDHIGTIPVVRHAIQFLAQTGQMSELVCCIYPTAPFITASALERGMNTLLDSDSDYAFSVTSYTFPIQRAVRIDPAGRIQMLQPEHFTTRSQDLEEAFHDAGQFYWGRSTAWLEEKPLFSSHAASVILPRSHVQDIDTVEDWERAELMFKALKSTI